MEKVIYCDNAATSWPKPTAVDDAMARFHRESGGNPGRSGHRMSLDAGRLLLHAREKLAGAIGAADPFSVVLTSGATLGLNIATSGLLRPGDHIIASPFEHNAVMRSLRYLETLGVGITILPHDGRGVFDPEAIPALVRKNTRALYMVHASNVTGAIQPVERAAALARERDILVCVDLAASAGCLPLDVSSMNCDMAAFSGHKGFLGPQGTGGLYIRPGIERHLSPIIRGGTGSRSEEEIQPDFMPDRFEPGTPNTVGFAGLCASVDYIMERGIVDIRAHEIAVTSRFLDGLASMRGITVHGPLSAAGRTSVVSITSDRISPSELAERLDEGYGILTRPGLHCAPAAHRAMGTFPEGTVRFSFGPFTTAGEIDMVLAALDEITTGGHR